MLLDPPILVGRFPLPEKSGADSESDSDLGFDSDLEFYDDDDLSQEEWDAVKTFPALMNEAMSIIETNFPDRIRVGSPPPRPEAIAFQEAQSTREKSQTLWIGGLKTSTAELYLHECFPSRHEVLSAMIERDELSDRPKGYGFICFPSHASAEEVLQTYNGTLMPDYGGRTFLLDWATFTNGQWRRDDAASHLSTPVDNPAQQHYSSQEGEA